MPRNRFKPADFKPQAQVFYRLMTSCVMKFFPCVRDVKSDGGGR